MALGEEKKIKILVVDDSAFMRKAITMMLESDPMIKVIGSAQFTMLMPRGNRLFWPQNAAIS